MRVLILGGTPEARELAAALEAAGHAVTLSLAGRVPGPPGAARVGGFGGAEGLARWVGEHAIDALVDATHPFAERISAHAARAGVPLLRLLRPGWSARPGDDWTWVDDLRAAAERTAGHRVLLTTGHALAAFGRTDAFYLVRAITPPPGPLPPRHELLLARGPFTEASERELLEHRGLDLLVTKDSGGATAKLDAARALGVPVVLVRRPRLAHAETVTTVAEALARFDIGPMR